MSIDKILLNGSIYTMNKASDTAQAIAIEDNKIAAVGGNDKILELKGQDTEIIDLGGKMVLPGFIDAHCHPSMCAFFEKGIVIEEEMDIDEILATIRAGIEAAPDEDSYVGIGFNECLFDEKGPRREMLDEICSDKPIMLLGSSAHVGWCNTKTLQLANITSDTPDPIPGFHYFERDDDGTPTGYIVECSAEGIIFNNVDFFKKEDLEKGFLSISESYAEMGVTSLADCGSFDWMEELGLPVLDDLMDNEKFLQRMFGCVLVSAEHEKDSALKVLKERSRKYNSDRYRVNTYKIVLDGTMETRTASMSQPYNEDGRIVQPLFEGKEIEDIFLAAAKEGFDIHSHGIGDKAIRENLRGAAAVRNAGFKDTRITNAHTDYVLKEDRPLFAKYDVIVNTTGVWHYGNDEMDSIIGADRAAQQFTIKEILDHGARLSLGSDRPVDEFGAEPLKGIEGAMTRKLVGRKGAPVLPPEDQCLELQECLEGYTCNAAWQLHMEGKLGELSEGAYADIVILQEDLFNVAPDEIHSIPVIMTIANGKVIYERS